MNTRFLNDKKYNTIHKNKTPMHTIYIYIRKRHERKKNFNVFLKINN